MKTLYPLVFAAVVVLVGFSCQKKTNSNAITPDYSATGNPNPNVQTVTGATSYTNPATKNTSILIGTSGWSNLTCLSTNSATLRGDDGTSVVTLNFSGAASTGTYAIAAAPAAGSCAMTIKDAPNQPAGIVWYGKTGNVVVNVTGTSIFATFSNVVCTQQSFNFPTVAASGTLSCSQ